MALCNDKLYFKKQISLLIVIIPLFRNFSKVFTRIYITECCALFLLKSVWPKNCFYFFLCLAIGESLCGECDTSIFVTYCCIMFSQLRVLGNYHRTQRKVLLQSRTQSSVSSRSNFEVPIFKVYAHGKICIEQK